MSEVRDTVTLHPETVKKGEKLARKARAARQKPRESKPEPEVKRRYTKRPDGVSPCAWEIAQEAIRQHGYSEKVIVLSERSLMIVNED